MWASISLGAGCAQASEHHNRRNARPSSRIAMRLFYCTRLQRARGLAALGSRRGFAPLDLRAPAALRQIAAAFSLAASLGSMLLMTSVAPIAWASRVAVPLCCSTFVFPVMVARPPWTCTSNLSSLIFESAKRARIAFSSWASVWAVAAAFFTVATGLAAGCARHVPAQRGEEDERGYRSMNRQDGLPV